MADNANNSNIINDYDSILDISVFFFPSESKYMYILPCFKTWIIARISIAHREYTISTIQADSFPSQFRLIPAGPR